MTIFETLSQRNKKKDNAGKQDVCQYHDLPQNLRVQIIHIWRDTIGYWRTCHFAIGPDNSTKLWIKIHGEYIRAVGAFALSRTSENHQEDLENYFLSADVGTALDIIDFIFNRFIYYSLEIRNGSLGDISVTESIEQLNFRLLQHGIGYEFINLELIRKDSQYIHSETVKPAINLLHETKFKGASDEFLRAHEHYRQGRNKEAITEAAKAFESTLKTICTERKWAFQSTDNAKNLIETVFNEELIPKSLSTQFNALRSLLEAGLPTVRNKTSAHGQGAQVIEVPQHMAAYALHLAASNIVFLVEAHKAKK